MYSVSHILLCHANRSVDSEDQVFRDSDSKERGTIEKGVLTLRDEVSIAEGRHHEHCN